MTKVLNKLILHRVRDALDAYLSPLQNAYRPERSCAQHILAASELIALARRSKSVPLMCLFVDFSKAFDSIDRVALRLLLNHWKCPTELTHLIFQVLDQQQLSVRYQTSLGDAFTPTAGVLQGDTLAPYLFLLPMDLIFRAVSQLDCGARLSSLPSSAGTRSRPKSVWIPRLPALGYADDVILFSNSVTDAQKMLTRLEDVAAMFGLKCNVGPGKTEAMYISLPAAPIYLKSGALVTTATSYKYLGTLLGTTWKEDFSRRRGLAWALLHQYNNVWSAAHIHIDVKRHLFHALVTPHLTYSCISYPWTALVRKTINQCYQRMLRYALGVRPNWTEWDHLPIESLIGDSRLFLSAQIVYERLRSIGHWLRQHCRKDNTILHPALWVLAWNSRADDKLRNKRGGALQISPKDSILRMAGFELDSWGALVDTACNKSAWRLTVEKAVLAEQLAVADTIAKRRAAETAKGRIWTEEDHAKLLDYARKACTTHLQSHKSN